MKGRVGRSVESAGSHDARLQNLDVDTVAGVDVAILRTSTRETPRGKPSELAGAMVEIFRQLKGGCRARHTRRERRLESVSAFLHPPIYALYPSRVYVELVESLSGDGLEVMMEGLGCDSGATSAKQHTRNERQPLQTTAAGRQDSGKN